MSWGETESFAAVAPNGLSLGKDVNRLKRVDDLLTTRERQALGSTNETETPPELTYSMSNYDNNFRFYQPT